jgi:hypothetical protein
MFNHFLHNAAHVAGHNLAEILNKKYEQYKSNREYRKKDPVIYSCKIVNNTIRKISFNYGFIVDEDAIFNTNTIKYKATLDQPMIIEPSSTVEFTTNLPWTTICFNPQKNGAKIRQNLIISNHISMMDIPIDRKYYCHLDIEKMWKDKKCEIIISL